MGGAPDTILQRWLRIIVATVAVALALTTLVTYRLVRELQATNQSVLFEDAERLRNVDGLAIAVYNRSANARGYLLSGDATFLEARTAARAEIARRMPAIRALRGAAEASARLDELLARQDAATKLAFDTYLTSPAQAREVWDQNARPIQQQIEIVVEGILAGQVEAFEEARRQAGDASSRAIWLLVSLLLAVALVVSVLMYAYARTTRSLLRHQRAQQEQETFRLLDQVPVGVFVATPDGKPYYANRHAQRILGQGVATVGPGGLARTYSAYEIGVEREYPNERLPLVRALAGEVSEVSDMEIRRDDDVIPLHVNGAPVYNANNELIYAIVGFQDVRELQRVAMRDPLTGLINRAALAQTYSRDRALTARRNRPLAIGLIDLDRFKSINDTYGHAMGDEVLKRASAAIVNALRRADVVGRWGGEEIAVLMPDTDVAGARTGIENALAAVRALSFSSDAKAFEVTFSAGVVVADAEDTLDTAVSRADKLLYAAKQAGRNRVHAD